MSRVGFIGLGTMGRPMARNLMKAGHELASRPAVTRWRPSSRQPCARCADSPAEVARGADYVVTIVTADAEVREVVFGPGEFRTPPRGRC